MINVEQFALFHSTQFWLEISNIKYIFNNINELNFTFKKKIIIIRKICISYITA